MTTLTPKQERFCHEYMVDLNATQAAIRAGYSEKTAQEQASRLLSKVIVKTRISELQAEVAARTDVTIDDVIGMLRESYRDAKAANQHGPAIRAVELLGKRHGMFTDVHKQADGEDLTPEEANGATLSDGRCVIADRHVGHLTRSPPASAPRPQSAPGAFDQFLS